MTAAVGITRTELDAAGLRCAAGRSRDAAAARRMLALVFEGKSRAQAAQAAGMDRQTLRDWVHRHNEAGLAGLSDRHGDGTRRLLSAEQEAELARRVRQGPDLVERCAALGSGAWWLGRATGTGSSSSHAVSHHSEHERGHRSHQDIGRMRGGSHIPRASLDAI